MRNRINQGFAGTRSSHEMHLFSAIYCTLIPPHTRVKSPRFRGLTPTPWFAICAATMAHLQAPPGSTLKTPKFRACTPTKRHKRQNVVHAPHITPEFRACNLINPENQPRNSHPPLSKLTDYSKSSQSRAASTARNVLCCK